MKKLFTLALLASALSVNAQTRLSLVEHFTGENCPPCAADNPAFESLLNSGTNPSKVVHITWMEPIPSAGPFYNTTQALIHSRMWSFYGSTFGTTLFTPSCVLDGVLPDASSSQPGFIIYFTQADINTASAVAAPFNMTAYHTFNAAKDSVFITVNVTAVSNFNGSPRLYTAWVKNMNFASAPGTNGEKNFENVVRDLFPTPSCGQSAATTGTNDNLYVNAYTTMATSWTAGQHQTYIIKGKVKGLDGSLNFTSNDSFAVAWIQNFSDKKVAQTAVSSLATAYVPKVVNNMENVMVYPNPADNFIMLQGNFSTATPVKLSLINAIGQTVLEKEYNASNNTLLEKVSLSNICAGLYFVRISNNGETITRKLTVNK